MIRRPIFSQDDGTRQIGYQEDKEAFSFKGEKLYDIDGLNLIDPETGRVVGHLTGPSGNKTAAADYLFP